MARADYRVVKTTEDTVWIVDEDKGSMSVTNDCEAVVREVASQYPARRIVARDTMGQWDELVHENGVFKGWKSWTGEVPE